MTHVPVAIGQPTGSEVLQLVGFGVGGEEYCVDILKVQEIIRLRAITAMPSGPDYLEGVINLRGRVIPIIDFRKRFHVADGMAVDERSRRIVVVSLQHGTAGLIVDRVSQVFKLPAKQISSAPAAAKGCDTDAIVGVGQLGERLVIVLDLELMLATELNGFADEQESLAV